MDFYKDKEISYLLPPEKVSPSHLCWIIYSLQTSTISLVVTM